MWEIIMTIAAFVFGMAAIAMVWITNYQTKTLNRQLDGINNRLGILRQDLEAQQSATSREVFYLKSKVDELNGKPVTVNGNSHPEPVTPSAPPALQEMTPQQLQARLQQGDELVVVDMRQAYEYYAGHIPDAIHMFVNEIPIRLNELPKDKDIVLQCWHGHTSLQALAYLIEQGWPPAHLFSLSGGMAGWTQANGTASLVRR